MADYIDFEVTEGTETIPTFEESTLRKRIEAFFASFSALTGILTLYVSSNRYIRANALQSVVLFVGFIVIGMPFFILSTTVGSIFSGLYVLFIVVYVIIKILHVGLAILRSRNEAFFGIPYLSDWIYTKAGSL